MRFARNGGGIRTIKKGGPFFFAIATRTKDFKYIKINKKSLKNLENDLDSGFLK